MLNETVIYKTWHGSQYLQSFTYPRSSSFRKLGVIRCNSSKTMFKGAPCVVITTSPHCGWVWFIAKSPVKVNDAIWMIFTVVSVGIIINSMKV